MTDQPPFEQVLQPLDELARLVASNGHDDHLARLIDQARQNVANSLGKQAATIAALQQQLDDATRFHPQHKVAREHELLVTLSDTAASLLEQTDLDQLLHDILVRAAQLLDTQNGVVYLYDAALDVMEVKIAIGQSRSWLGFQIARGREGIINQVWRTGQPATVDNYATWERRLSGIEVPGTPALLAIPLLVGDEVIGVLGLYRADGRGFAPSAVEVAHYFGRLAAVALHNARLHTALQRELTERRNTEAALRASEHRLQRLVEGLPAGAVYREGDRLWLNRQAETITGYSRHELTTVAEWLGCNLPCPPPAAPHESEQTPERGATEPLIASLHRKDGLIRSVEITTYSDETATVWLLQDVTERERAIRLLAQTERAANVGGWELVYPERQLFWTAEMFRILELDPASFTPTTTAFKALQPPHVIEAQETAIRTCFETGQPIDLEIEQWTSSGRRIWTRMCAQVEFDAGGSAARLYGSVQDITERKRVEQALRKSEEKYRTLIETTATGYAITDETGLILEANAEYLRLNGRHTLEEVIGHYPWEWTAPYDRERNQAAFAALLEAGVLRSFEVDYITAAGETMPVEINATVLQTDEGARVLAMLRDIRTRKAAAAALAESELRFRQLAEHVDGVFWLTDANPDRLLYVSPAYERFWGRPAANLFSDPWDWLQPIHPEDRQRVYEAINTKQLTGQYDEEYRLIQPDGSVRWVRDRSFPVTDQEGRVYRVAGLTEDITGRKMAAEALRTSEERFRQLAENIDQAFWLVDDSGVLYVSPAYERIWGRSAASFYADPWGWLECVHPDDRARVQQAVLKNQAVGAYHEVYRILRPDGSIRWVRDRAFPICDDTGVVVRVAGLAEDITEKILHERALQLLLDCARVTGQAFFATLVETLAAVLGVRHVLLWELIDRRAVSVRLVAAWHGGEPAGENAWSIRQSPGALAALEELTWIREGAQQRFPADPLLEFYRAESFLAAPLRSSTGATVGLLVALDERPLAEAGNPAALLEIFAGQTATELERQQAEAEIKKLNAELEQRVLDRTAQLAAANEALRFSEQRLRQIIDLVPHPIFAKDINGCYLLANQAEAEYLDATVEALPGKSPVDFGYPAEIVADWQRCNLELIASGQPRAIHLQRVPDLQGRMRVLHTTIMPFKRADDDEPAIVGISIDITEQQRVEEELRQSEARQRALLAAMPDMVFRISRHGYFRDFSAPEEIGMLLPREQIIGAHVRDIPLPSEAIEASLAAYERAIVTGAMQTVEYSVATPEGLQYFESRIVRSGADEVVSIIRDITERKRSVEALRLSEQRLRQIIDLVPHLIFAKDITGRFVLANRASAAIFGTTPNELVGKSDADFSASPEEIEKFRADDCEVIERNTIKVIPVERITDFTGRVHLMQTIKIPFTFSGASTPAVLGVATDITELKRTEMALRESEARFRQFAEHMPFIVWMVAIDGGHFVYLNSAFEEITGYALADRGPYLRAWLDVVHREDVRTMLAFARHLTRLEPMQVDVRIVRPEGELRWLRIYYFPVRNEAGVLVLHSGIAEDITERKEAEAEIYRLNEELEERVRQRTHELEVANRELESFSYSVSHDLRAPLRAINGFSQALAEDYGHLLGRDGLDYLERVRAASQRMAQLIDDLLMLSRVTRQEMRRTLLNLSPLASAIANELQAAQPERQVTFTVAPDLWVTGDPRLLRIVLDNLLHNAWKYTGKHAQAHIEVGAIHQPEGTVFFVRDDGAGFDMAYVDKLFGAFQRLHRDAEFEGTGVGLATVQRIIHRHGGRTWAEGRVEGGATFYFTLPDGTRSHEQGG